MKGLINIKNDDNKCFMWCHVRHLNCVDKNLGRIKKKDRGIAKGLNYSGVGFSVSKKDYSKIEVLNKICVNVFCYENKMVYPVYLSNQSFNDSIDLLLIMSKFTSNYVHIKDFNRLMFNKTKNKNKKYFCKSCLQCFSSEKVLINHEEDCLMINGAQNVKLEKGFIEFKNFGKQIHVPFKIYADFECLLKVCDVGVDNDCFSFCSFTYKVVCVNNKFSKNVVLYRAKNAILKFIMSVYNDKVRYHITVTSLSMSYHW